MRSTRPNFPGGGFGGGPGGGLLTKPPKDLLVLLGTLFVTFSLQFFEATRWIPELLRLSEDVFPFKLWKLMTYAFTGWGGPSPFILLWMLMILMFGGDIFRRLGRQQFWLMIAWGVGLAGIAATLVHLLADLLGSLSANLPFQLMQGQHMIFAICLAAFATLYRDAVVMLFFVIPIRARWFIPIEIAFAFVGFLGSRDLAGFVGIVTAVGVTYSLLTPGGARRLSREGWLRLQQAWMKLRLKILRKRRRIRVVKDDEVHRGPWVN